MIEITHGVMDLKLVLSFIVAPWTMVVLLSGTHVGRHILTGLYIYICKTPKSDGHAKVRWIRQNPMVCAKVRRSRQSPMVCAKVRWCDTPKSDGWRHLPNSDGLSRQSPTVDVIRQSPMVCHAKARRLTPFATFRWCVTPKSDGSQKGARLFSICFYTINV